MVLALCIYSDVKLLIMLKVTFDSLKYSESYAPDKHTITKQKDGNCCNYL